MAPNYINYVNELHKLFLIDNYRLIAEASSNPDRLIISQSGFDEASD